MFNVKVIRFLTFYFSFHYNFFLGLGDDLERKIDKCLVPHIIFVNVEVLSSPFISQNGLLKEKNICKIGIIFLRFLFN